MISFAQIFFKHGTFDIKVNISGSASDDPASCFLTTNNVRSKFSLPSLQNFRGGLAVDGMMNNQKFTVS